MTKPTSGKVGDGACPLCGSLARVSAQKTGHLMLTCGADDCGHQLFSRYDATDRRLAEKITKWVRPEDRRAYLGDDPPPLKTLPPSVRKAEPRGKAARRANVPPKAAPEPAAPPAKKPADGGIFG